MKLYFTPGVCSLASHIVAKALDLPVSLVKVNLVKKQTSDGKDFLSINKKGYVPALELDDGTVLTEGTAILQYLADQKPEGKMAPANGTIERYRLQEWLGFINSEVHKSYSPFFQKDASEQTRQAALAKLENRFGFVADHLATNAFLLGDQFTAADAYLFTTMSWASFANLDFSKWPVLVAYQARVAELPYVKAAIEAEKS